MADEMHTEPIRGRSKEDAEKQKAQAIKRLEAQGWKCWNPDEEPKPAPNSLAVWALKLTFTRPKS